MAALNVVPEFAELVPDALVCQYHVSPAGGVPLLVKVTPASAHCGELEVGLPGSAGNGFTVISIAVDTLSAQGPEITVLLNQVVCVNADGL